MTILQQTWLLAIHQWQRGLPPVTATLDGLLVATLVGSQNLWVNLRWSWNGIIWKLIFFPGWFVQRIPLKCWICDPKSFSLTSSSGPRSIWKVSSQCAEDEGSTLWNQPKYDMFPFLRSINDSLMVNVLVVLLFYYIPVNVHETNLYMKKNLRWYNHQHKNHFTKRSRYQKWSYCTL